MFKTTLRYGMQTATEVRVEPEGVHPTVGQQIESLLEAPGSVRAAHPMQIHRISPAVRSPCNALLSMYTMSPALTAVSP